MVQDLGGMREALAWLFGNPFPFQQFCLGLLPQLIIFLILMGGCVYLWDMMMCVCFVCE